mgnify:FL=1
MEFSVLLSVYKKENPIYLKEALDSVWEKQTLRPTEVVVVEDGPLTKELHEVLEEFSRTCDCLVRCPIEKNVQLGRALAYGVTQCKYELIARMDTDDLAVPERFEKQCDYMQKHPDTIALGGWIEEFDEKQSYNAIKKMPENMPEIKEYAKYRNPLNHMTVMFRKHAILEAGNYEHYPMLEDYYLWIRLLAKAMELHNLPEVLVDMRIDDATYHRRGGKEYFRRYKKLRKYQYEMQLLNRGEYIKAVILTWGMTSEMVDGIRKILYHKILRR